MITGVERIARERLRQLQEEGFDGPNDDLWDQDELVRAAYCYLQIVGIGRSGTADEIPTAWPWADEWWKPSELPVRNLEKAGALIAAEIDRRLRAAARQ